MNITIAGRPVRVLHLALAALAAVTVLAVVLAVALSGHAAPAASSGSSGSPGLAACIASRLANGDATVQAQNPVLAQGWAREFCNMGTAFASNTDASLGVGPDTTGYNG